MLLNKLLKTSALLLISLFLFTPTSYSGGFDIPETDSLGDSDVLFFFFDLRDRESYVQLTNIDNDNATAHIQIWDVNNKCNENNFFDTYTPSDTHVYNMRDIQTNDGNPSGVELPDGAYGFVSVTIDFNSARFIGNFRVFDITGYEYRTNAINANSDGCCWNIGSPNITFNYNTKGNITLSDVVGITFANTGEISAADISNFFITFDVDILNEDEVIFIMQKRDFCMY